MKVQFDHIPETKIGQLFKDRTALKKLFGFSKTKISY